MYEVEEEPGGPWTFPKKKKTGIFADPIVYTTPPEGIDANGDLPFVDHVLFNFCH